MVQSAEVREAIEQRAYDAAGFEQKGAEAIYKASLIYQEMWDEGLSQEYIADQVTQAGFPISQQTVSNRLAALEGLPVTGEPSTKTLGLYTEQYAKKNNPEKPSGGGNVAKAVDPLGDWLHATYVLGEGGGKDSIAEAVALLGLDIREVIHMRLHEKEGVDE